MKALAQISVSLKKKLSKGIKWVGLFSTDEEIVVKKFQCFYQAHLFRVGEADEGGIDVDTSAVTMRTHSGTEGSLASC